MPKFHMTMIQRTTWEFELEADSLDHAEELSQDWGRDEMKEDEITDNCWWTDITELDSVLVSADANGEA